MVRSSHHLLHVLSDPPRPSTAPNALRLLDPIPHTLPSSPSPLPLPLDLILSLITRTSDVRLRSEATRILINTIRSLFSSPSSLSAAPGGLAASSPITPGAWTPTTGAGVEDELLKARRRGRKEVVRSEVVKAVSELVRLGARKYPMLGNEGVVGLTLLAGSGGCGGMLVS